MRPYDDINQLTDREREALSQVGQLNAYLSHSSIPEASRAALQRQRQQELEAMRAADRRTDTNRVALAATARQGSGPFKGSSMSAQMLNIWNNPNIPSDDPLKQQAKAYLSRPTTYTTPEGVTTTPGILGGQSTLTPRNPSGDEKRGELAVTQIQSADPGKVRPGFFEEFAQENLPASVASLFTSDAYALDLAEQRQYLSNLIYLQSGAAASPEEVEKRRLEFFPQNNDSDAVMKRKRQNLDAFKRDAANAFQNRQGTRPGDKYLR